MQINIEYEILNNSGNFVDFLGVEKSQKKKAIKVTLENNMSITVSEDHIFIASNMNIYAKSLIPNVVYLTTTDGDFYVKSVEPVDDCDLYDIVDSESYEYFANGILNHNCSFLGSGDNFIAEEYLRRIEEDEVLPPKKQEYTDNNFWIWEDPIPEENYIMAIDASAGHGDDNSTINILKTKEIIDEKIIKKDGDTKKIKFKRNIVDQVAEYYGKVTPQMLAEIAYQFGRRYGDAYAVVDITNGYGVQTIEKLLEVGYSNIHYSEVTHKPSRDRLHGYIKKGQKKMPDGKIITIDLIPGFFIGGNRASILLEMQRSVHLKDVIIKSTRLLNELKTFVTVPGNRVADHKRSFHDDSIMGLSIGLYVLNYDLYKYKQNKGSSKKMLDAMLNINDTQNMANKTNSNTSRPDIRSAEYRQYSWLFK